MPFEAEPLESLARDGQLMAYRHTGFWKAMDTLRDKNELEGLWAGGHAPWRLWK
jgi:glucose-1-phosphate cytidylyltransferase